MDKFVIENTLYFLESLNENMLTSYDDVNLINSSNNKINNHKLIYIDKNIKMFDRLERGLILPLNIQKFAQIDSNLMKETEKLTSNLYIDVTNDWVKKCQEINKKIKIFHENEIFEYNGQKYLVDNHYVKYRAKLKEIKFAEWLSKNTRLKIQLNPEVEYPENISVADCTIYKNDELLGNYDIKIVTGSSKQLLFHNVYGKEKQSINFLFEATQSPLSMKELIMQAEEIFRRKAKWVKEIGIKKEDSFIVLKNKNTKNKKL